MFGKGWAGLAAGLVASWTMNQFQAAWTRVAEGFEKPHGAQAMQPSEGPNRMKHPARVSPSRRKSTGRRDGRNGEGNFEKPSSVTSFRRVKRKPRELRSITLSAPRPVDCTVRWLGCAAGNDWCGHSVWRCVLGCRRRGGSSIAWLAKAPTEYPVSTHVYALASHLVYGVTAELSCCAVRQIL